MGGSGFFGCFDHFKCSQYCVKVNPDTLPDCVDDYFHGTGIRDLDLWDV